MTVAEFINTQESENKNTFIVVNDLILQYDPAIRSKIGSVMSEKRALVYEEEGVFKYGLTKTKNHFSYHSMVMYAYPEVSSDLKARTKGIKFQKGCFNFTSIDQLNLEEFRKFLEESAKKDFRPIIDRYKK